MAIINYDPATLVRIKVEDLSAPVQVGAELSKIYLTTDEVIRQLLLDVQRDEDTGELNLPPELLPWLKEQRMLLSEIHKMTGDVQNKTNLKKMELATEIFKEYFKTLPNEDRVKIVKKLKKDGNPLK